MNSGKPLKYFLKESLEKSVIYYLEEFLNGSILFSIVPREFSQEIHQQIVEYASFLLRFFFFSGSIHGGISKALSKAIVFYWSREGIPAEIHEDISKGICKEISEEAFDFFFLKEVFWDFFKPIFGIISKVCFMKFFEKQPYTFLEEALMDVLKAIFLNKMMGFVDIRLRASIDGFLEKTLRKFLKESLEEFPLKTLE